MKTASCSSIRGVFGGGEDLFGALGRGRKEKVREIQTCMAYR